MTINQVEESWRRKAERVDLAVAELVRYRQKVQKLLDELVKHYWQHRGKGKDHGQS